METCPICRKPRKLTNDETESMRKFLIWKLGEDRVYGAEAETAAQAFLIQTMCSCSRHPLDKLRLLFVSSTGTVLLATIAVWVFFPYAVNRTFILWCTSVAYTAALLALLLILLGDAYAESESGTHVWSISQRAATVSQVWDSNRHRITSSQMKRVWRCISIVSGFIVAITAPFILARAISARVCLGDVTSVSAIIGGCNAIANFLVVVVFFRRIRAGMRRDCERILGRLDKPSEWGLDDNVAILVDLTWLAALLLQLPAGVLMIAQFFAPPEWCLSPLCVILRSVAIILYLVVFAAQLIILAKIPLKGFGGLFDIHN